MGDVLDDVAKATLAAEILGFPPQLLLDDLISAAHDSVSLTVSAIEAFLRDWITNKAPPHMHEDLWKELEEGLVRLQTLLDANADWSMDLFEAWSLRNIFAVPDDITLGTISTGHQRGLDLTITAEEERRMQEEVDELRKKVDAMNHLEGLLKKGVRASEISRQRAEKVAQDLAFLANTHKLRDGPQAAETLYQTMLETPDDPPIPPPPDNESTNKPEWETSHEGYVGWSVKQLVQSGSRPPEELDGSLAQLSAQLERTGDEASVRKMKKTNGLGGAEANGMDVV